MTSPTFHTVPAAGVEMTAVGGVFPTEMTTESVPVAPAESVTRSDAVTSPSAV